MATETVSVDRRGPVAVVRIDRPPANAIELGVCEEALAAIERLLLAPPGAIVLTGSRNAFSAGLDLKIVPTYDRDRQRSMLRIVNRLVARLYASPIPVVAAINGYAIAAGFILALTADYRVGPTGSALFGLTEARAGIPFPAGPMVVLNAELEARHVRTLTLTARNIGPEQALAMGVVDELRPPGTVLNRAVEVATDLASISREGYARVKQQVRAAAIARLEEIDRGEDPMLTTWFSGDAAAASTNILKNPDHA